MSRVIWSPQALHDLESIRDFIARDSPLYAGFVIQRLVASVDRLGVFPKSGRVVPELGRSDVREVIQLPFRIVYRLSGDGVEVATVFRSSRLFRGAE